MQALVMDFVPGRPFSSDNYRSLTVDSVCTEDGFARLGIKPQSMVACARQYLGALEDNARLSHNRAGAGRPRAIRP
jgi:NADH dehydrogenase